MKLFVGIGITQFFLHALGFSQEKGEKIDDQHLKTLFYKKDEKFLLSNYSDFKDPTFQVCDRYFWTPWKYRAEIDQFTKDLLSENSNPISSLEFKATLNVPNTIDLSLKIFDGSNEEIEDQIPVTIFQTNEQDVHFGVLKKEVKSNPLVIKSSGNAVKIFATEPAHISPDLQFFRFTSPEGNFIEVEAWLDFPPTLDSQNETLISPGGYVIQKIGNNSSNFRNNLFFKIRKGTFVAPGFYTLTLVFKTYADLE